MGTASAEKRAPSSASHRESGRACVAPVMRGRPPDVEHLRSAMYDRSGPIHPPGSESLGRGALLPASPHLLFSASQQHEQPRCSRTCVSWQRLRQYDWLSALSHFSHKLTIPIPALGMLPISLEKGSANLGFFAIMNEYTIVASA